MKKTLLLFLVLIIISCSNTSKSDKIIGKWCYEDSYVGLVHFKFSSDYLKIKDTMGVHIANWNTRNDKLNITIQESDFLFEGEKYQYDFKLIENDEKLYMKIEGDTIMEFKYFTRCNSIDN